MIISEADRREMQFYQSLVSEAQEAEPILALFRIMDEHVRQSEPMLTIQNEGYRVIVYSSTDGLPGLIPRLFEVDPQRMTKIMRLGGEGVTRRRYCAEGRASILIARADRSIFQRNMSEIIGLKFPVTVASGDVACMRAGIQGARIYDLAPVTFDPKTMESPVQVGDQSVSQEFWDKFWEWQVAPVAI